ncbi:MAG: DUF3574 domain-containing protein [Planctomycetota bacterium]|nr:MAG: DUF3574 domain-containing protein [Planctomycetota bacterium]
MREVSRRLLVIAIAGTLFCAAGCETWTDTEAGNGSLIKTELYFGLCRPDESTISEVEWEAFVDEYITPRFKEGLTIVDAAGQWMGENGELVKEETKIVILFHRNSGDKKAAIEYIRDKYKGLFGQEAVTKVTSYPQIDF